MQNAKARDMSPLCSSLTCGTHLVFTFAGLVDLGRTIGGRIEVYPAGTAIAGTGLSPAGSTHPLRRTWFPLPIDGSSGILPTL